MTIGCLRLSNARRDKNAWRSRDRARHRLGTRWRWKLNLIGCRSIFFNFSWLTIYFYVFLDVWERGGNRCINTRECEYLLARLKKMFLKSSRETRTRSKVYIVIISTRSSGNLHENLVLDRYLGAMPILERLDSLTKIRYSNLWRGVNASSNRIGCNNFPIS